MRYNVLYKILFCFVVYVFSVSILYGNIRELHSAFENFTINSKPGVYWYFMDGNISKDEITKDLESMKIAGIGSVIFLEVNVGIPKGKIKFMSDEWKDCFKHAVKECERLDICMILGIGPGWSGSGGPWITPEKSMRHIVASETNIDDKCGSKIYLSKPFPFQPYFGVKSLGNDSLRWYNYYKDLKVLAFPNDESDGNRISDISEKALYVRAPYSSRKGVKPYLTRETHFREGISLNKIIDLTEKLKGDTLYWKVPKGKWTVMRFGLRNNGAITRPAPEPGLGFECDKSDSLALKEHFSFFIDELLSYKSTDDNTIDGGLKLLHLDSWEVGAQNWSPYLKEYFLENYGYDPVLYLPVLSGLTVENTDVSERFLWDLRQCMQKLILEQHVRYVKDYARKKKMKISIEPYDMNPMQDLELGALADFPMCEFWTKGKNGYNTSFSVIEATSLAHIKGQNVVPAEAFTKRMDGWREHPASIKNQSDWALSLGVTKFMFHTFQHQCLPDSLRPGMTMGLYGVHWDRNQTWWPYVGEFHKYLSRCQSILQLGISVNDVLFVSPEEAPFVFKSPRTFVTDSILPDKKGYGFDVCPPSLLKTAVVNNSEIVFPSGTRYKVIVISDFRTMTVGLLKTLERLVKNGARLIGVPPVSTPGLSSYITNDKELDRLSKAMWKDSMDKEYSVLKYGMGYIISGKSLSDSYQDLYPDYDFISDCLRKMKIEEDFSSDIAKLRYNHRKFKDTDIYFVSNKTNDEFVATCNFRVEGKNCYLWNPVTSEKFSITPVGKGLTTTSLKIRFEKDQSWFVIFSADVDEKIEREYRLIDNDVVMCELNNPWILKFDTKWGGPATEIVFKNLEDWSKSDNDSIKYYSGTVIYESDFDLFIEKSNEYIIDLGSVKNIAKLWINGKEVGVLWGEPWKANITDYIHKGKNSIKIEVTNLWGNRLIGDEKKLNDVVNRRQWPEWIIKSEHRPSDRYTFATYKHYNDNSKLFESGLLGPVRIVIEKR